MGIFKKKIEPIDKLKKLVSDLENMYQYVCPEVIEEIKEDVNRDYNFKYNHSDPETNLAELVFTYGWRALSKTDDKEYNENELPIFTHKDNYHNENGRLNQRGIDLLTLVIEYSGKAIGNGSLTFFDLLNNVKHFCYVSNIFSDEEYH